jgi:S-(hydroxymethyl)glutathione dehydrogenase / alcohol dehydrogenase
LYFKAAVLEKKNKIQIHSLKNPSKLKRGQVLVKIFYSSICHTQLQEIELKRGEDHYLPHCLGHEGVGIITKTYSKCKKFKKGDRVCLSWVKSRATISKGHIYINDKGKKINSGPVHTLNEYAVVDESRIYKLEDKKNLKNQVLLGCAMPTIFNIFLENKIKKKASIIVLGGGGLGLSFILLASQMGFKNLSLLERNKKKILYIKKKIKIQIYNSIEKISLSSFDLAIECTGNIKIFEKSINLVKKFGGKVVVVGNYEKQLTSKLNPWNIIEGKTLKGVWNSKINYKDKFKKLEKIFKSLSTNFLFSNKVYKLTQINKAINDFKNGKVIRPLIKMI